jgi:hypothetical protein
MKNIKATSAPFDVIVGGSAAFTVSTDWTMYEQDQADIILALYAHLVQVEDTKPSDIIEQAAVKDATNSDSPDGN